MQEMTENPWGVVWCWLVTACVIGTAVSYSKMGEPMGKPEPEYRVEPLSSAHGSWAIYRGDSLIQASSDAVFLRHFSGLLNAQAEADRQPGPIVTDSPIGGK